MVMSRFGSVRELPSGMFQARYRPSSGDPVTAPTTFPSAEQARAWLDGLKAGLDDALPPEEVLALADEFALAHENAEGAPSA